MSTIRENSIKDVFMKNKDKINFIPYYDFLKLIPSSYGSKEALLLAFLIDEDGKDYNRLPDNPSWFKCSRKMMCEALGIKQQLTIDKYLDNLQFWGFIKYEAIQLPKSPLCTYVELQGDLIEKLAIYYNKLIEDKKYDDITYIYSLNRYIYKEYIDIYIKNIQTCIYSINKSNNSINNSTNKREIKAPIDSAYLENNKKDIYTAQEPAADPTMWDYKSLRIPTTWVKQGRDKYGDSIFKRKLDMLDKFLVKTPTERQWVFTGRINDFFTGLDRADSIMGHKKKERDVRL